MELTFSAKYEDQPVSLDSIFIENLTQGGDTIIYSPDTVLVLGNATYIEQYGSSTGKSFTLSQNYPNPCSTKTSIDISLPEGSSTQIIICDVTGRECGYFSDVLAAGKHIFSIYPGNNRVYLLSVIFDNQQKSIKIINTGDVTASISKCQIIHTSHENEMNVNPSVKSTNTFVFQAGDELRYIGYSNPPKGFLSSDLIEDSPISSTDYEFNVNEGIPCPGVPYIYYKSLKYHTVQIGTQCWLKEYLNVGTMIPASMDMTDNGVLEKYCYDDDTLSCNYWGALYQWNEIMKYTIINGTQGICPYGWHIPTDEEIKQLEGYVDSFYPIGDPEWDRNGPRGFDVGLNLKSKTGWNSLNNGLDKYGFAAYPTGFRTYYGNWQDWGLSSGYWSSTGDSVGAYTRVLLDEIYYQQKRNAHVTNLGFSVKCLKD
jgi:uncharacterized protein (TIGR02145 family)